jgi:predicted transcriptional regulator
MNTTAIRQRLSNFMQIADDKKVKGLYALLEDEMQEGERISVAQYNKEIDAAMEEVKRGEVYSHEEVVQMSKKW